MAFGYDTTDGLCTFGAVAVSLPIATRDGFEGDLCNYSLWETYIVNR